MVKRLRVMVWSAILVTAVAVAISGSLSARGGLTVHEWGTFTSIAGPDGRAVNWAPLAGPQDLPCFVTEETVKTPWSGLTSVQVKGRDIFGMLKILPGSKLDTPQPKVSLASLLPPPLFPGRVRMETPVLYFYSAEEATLNVKVGFAQGAMTEWYPKATATALHPATPLSTMMGTIEWPLVRVMPGATPSLPTTTGKSHYYAAREVDAAPVQVGSQHEKFLFYRGMADFQPMHTATLDDHKNVTVNGPVATKMILFENHNGKVGYRVATMAGGGTKLSRAGMTGSVDDLRADLVKMLTAEGLYTREAKAMVETWRDSWFEEGARVLYVIPKLAVDGRLPLTISPAPADIARVFVGRLELVTKEMKDDVERALKANDLDGLNRYGRFLDAIAVQMGDRPWMTEHVMDVATALRAVATRPQPAACQ